MTPLPCNLLSFWYNLAGDTNKMFRICSPIAVDGQTGEVRTQVPLDAGPSSLITGGVATHTFVVFASDAGSPQRTASTTIRILIDCPRNSAPLCPPTQMLHIPENPPLDSYVSKVKVGLSEVWWTKFTASPELTNKFNRTRPDRPVRSV